MIDYETFCKIRDCHDRQGPDDRSDRQSPKWLARSRFERPRPTPRSSLLDPFKGRITRLLDTHPYSAQQIFQRLREEGYGGGITILHLKICRRAGRLGGCGMSALSCTGVAPNWADV